MSTHSTPGGLEISDGRGGDEYFQSTKCGMDLCEVSEVPSFDTLSRSRERFRLVVCVSQRVLLKQHTNLLATKPDENIGTREDRKKAIVSGRVCDNLAFQSSISIRFSLSSDGGITDCDGDAFPSS
jgi:hypothetical protein